MKDKVSIIIPVYNTPKNFLDECINSIVNQTYRNIEIIIVDDGSKEEVAHICDEYKKMDDRVVVLHQKNGGISSARNNGMRNMTGEWVVFIDSDDWLDNDSIEILIKNSKNQDIVIAGFYIDNTPVKTIQETGTLNDNEKRELIQSMFLDNNKKFNYVGSACAKLYSMKFLIENGMQFEDDIATIGEDIIFNFELYNMEKINICFLRNNLYHYRTNEESVTHFLDKRILEKYNRFFNKMKNKFGKLLAEKYKEEFDYYIVRQINLFCARYIFVFNNKSSDKEKYKIIANIVAQEPYKSALQEVEFNKLPLKRKFMIIAIRTKCFVILKIMYEFNGWIKKRK